MNGKVKELVSIFIQKTYCERMGSGKLSRKFKCTVEDIKEAKRIAYKSGNNNTAKVTNRELPKILIFDIETSPVKAYIWGLWNEDIYIDRIISDFFCMSWSAKWLYSDEVYSEVLTSEEVVEENDGRIVKEMWKLLDEADIVIAHNAKKFDVPKLNARFILYDLAPPSPYKVIDTLEVAKKQFKFTSNKLDYLARIFDFEPKLETSFELWRDCLLGDKKSLEYMQMYNIQDVELLEEVYLKLRPWIQGHPNIGLYLEASEPVCTSCGSTNLIESGNYCTSTGKYTTYRCECGALSRVRVSKVPKEIRKSLLVSIPR